MPKGGPLPYPQHGDQTSVIFYRICSVFVTSKEDRRMFFEPIESGEQKIEKRVTVSKNMGGGDRGMK